jgi:REP element-mobilizing transposase RayT
VSNASRLSLPAALRDDGREDLLDRLALGCERFELGLLSYVLMGNHYHGLLRIPDARLSKGLDLRVMRSAVPARRRTCA